jgi:hypothetical protein
MGPGLPVELKKRGVEAFRRGLPNLASLGGNGVR